MGVPANGVFEMRWRHLSQARLGDPSVPEPEERPPFNGESVGCGVLLIAVFVLIAILTLMAWVRPTSESDDPPSEPQPTGQSDEPSADRANGSDDD